MQIKLNTALLFLSTVLLAKPASAAIWYEGFANTVSCSGTSFGCWDDGAVCCSLPTGYGYSVRFNSLPAGCQGQGYTDGSCSNFLFSVWGPGTQCWSGGGARATNINWFHSPQGRRSDGVAIEARAAANNNGTCAPAYFRYEDPNGIERTIKVPTGDANAAETIAKLYADKSFDTLATYEDFQF